MNQNYNYNQPPQPQPYYQQPPVQQKSTNGVGVASFVCGLICFLCNPFYLICLAAVILGIVGLCQAGKPKGLAAAGLILGIFGTITQVILDLVLSVFTLGLSFLF